MRFFQENASRDRVRSKFLEYLVREHGATEMAKAIAELDDDQFDAMCQLAVEGYTAVIDEQTKVVRL
jgi:hypothetical protein